MDTIAKVQKLLNALEDHGVQKFDAEGQKLVYSIYADIPEEDLTSSDAIPYILQQANGFHYPSVTYEKGYYFTPDGGKSVCTFTLAKRPLDEQLALVIINPRGPKAFEAIQTLSNIVRKFNRDNNLDKDGACSFYVKKISPALRIEILTHQKIKPEMVSWYKEAPYEDDTYPNIIIDVEKFTRELPGKLFEKKKGLYPAVKMALRSLQKKIGAPETLDAFKDFSFGLYSVQQDWPIAKTMVDLFFDENLERGHLSKKEDYYNMLRTKIEWRHDKDSVLRFLTCYKNQPIGVVVAERLGGMQADGKPSSKFGIYCLITTRTPGWSFSELQISMLLHEIAKRGGKTADLGGAEKYSLNHFQRKFLSADILTDNAASDFFKQPVPTGRQAPWIEYDL